MNIFRYKNFYLLVIGALVIASIGSIAIFGLKPGIDFTGGSILEVQYANERPSNRAVEEQLSGLDLGFPSIQPIGEKGLIIRTKDLVEEIHQEVLKRLGDEAKEARFESIGSVIGKEIRDKAVVITVLSLLGISLYVAFAFRRVTRPVRFWQWSGAVLITLVHDLLIPLGVLAVLGNFKDVQITIPIVVALLTVAGYSINDTIVVFDRVRENLIKRVGIDFEDTVNQSVRQTFTRSFSTGFTTLLSLIAIFFFGGETLKYFALTLIIGILAGTYSSIFLAPPLLLKWVKGWRG